MPRKRYSAQKIILESLAKGEKTWKELLQDTGLSKAALSTNLHKLEKRYQIVTLVSLQKPFRSIFKKISLGKLVTAFKALLDLEDDQKRWLMGYFVMPNADVKSFDEKVQNLLNTIETTDFPCADIPDLQDVLQS